MNQNLRVAMNLSKQELRRLREGLWLITRAMNKDLYAYQEDGVQVDTGDTMLQRALATDDADETATINPTTGEIAARALSLFATDWIEGGCTTDGLRTALRKMRWPLDDMEEAIQTFENNVDPDEDPMTF